MPLEEPAASVAAPPIGSGGAAPLGKQPQVVITVERAEEGRLLSKFLPAAFSRAAGSIHGLGTVRAEQVPVV